MSDETFRQNFRMTRQTFEFFCDFLNECDEIPKSFDCAGRPPISVQKHALIFLWFAGNECSLRTVSIQFNISISSVKRVVCRVQSALERNVTRFVKWPRGEVAGEISQKFFEFRGIDGILGAIDGSHIRIQKPHFHQECYVNRKGYHSVVLQGISTYDLSFIDIYCGWPGSVHDARVLRESPLFQAVEEKPDDFFPGDGHILGDSAYPLLPWLMVPYKDYGNLSHTQKRFNARHSGSRQVVENAFGLLKGRWRQLRCLDMQIEFIPGFVSACCVVHNICLKNHDSNDGFFDFNEADQLFCYPSSSVVSSMPVSAKDKRDAMAQKLMQ